MVSLLIKKNLKEMLLSKRMIVFAYLASFTIFMFPLLFNEDISKIQGIEIYKILFIPYLSILEFIVILNIDFNYDTSKINISLENLPITKKDLISSKYILMPIYCFINLLLYFVILFAIKKDYFFEILKDYDTNIYLLFLILYIGIFLQISISEFFISFSVKGVIIANISFLFFWFPGIEMFIKGLLVNSIIRISIFTSITLFIFYQSYRLCLSAFELIDFKGEKDIDEEML